MTALTSETLATIRHTLLVKKNDKLIAIETLEVPHKNARLPTVINPQPTTHKVNDLVWYAAETGTWTSIIAEMNGKFLIKLDDKNVWVDNLWLYSVAQIRELNKN